MHVWAAGIYEGGWIQLKLSGMLGLGGGICSAECHFLVYRLIGQMEKKKSSCIY